MKKEAKKRGRPSVLTPDTLNRLDYAFAMGCSDKEACSYANVSQSAFYNYLDKHPDYKEYRDALKLKPILKAKDENLKLIESGDPVHIRWFLERKCRDEYSTKSEVSIEAEGSLSIEARSEALRDYLKAFKG